MIVVAYYILQTVSGPAGLWGTSVWSLSSIDIRIPVPIIRRVLGETTQVRLCVCSKSAGKGEVGHRV